MHLPSLRRAAPGGPAFARLPSRWSARLRLASAARGACGAACVGAHFVAAGARAAGDCFLLDRPGVRELGAAELAAEPPAHAFARGERLEYAVHYFGVPVGRAAIEVARLVAYGERRLAHVVATARTNDFFSAIYRVDDRSEAWIDLDRLVTVRTATHTRHGRRKETYEEVDFDWTTHYVRIEEAKRHEGRVHRLAFDFGPFVYDTFDVFYAVRRLPLGPGFSAELPVYADRKVYGLRVDVGGRETLASPVLGQVETLVLRPYDTLDGRRRGSGAGKIWILADERRVPVRLTGWFSSKESFRVGGVRAELVGYRPGERSPAARPAPSEAGRARLARSIEGRPVWDPPAPLVEARRRSGADPMDIRYPIEWPETLGCPGGSDGPRAAVRYPRPRVSDPG